MENLRAEITELERSIPPESPLWIQEGENAFNPFMEDYTGRIPGFIYNHVLRRLATMSEADVEKMTAGAFNMEKAASDPAAFRGKLWNVHGVIGALTAVPLKEKELSDRKFVYQGAVFVGDRPVLLHVVDKPDVVYVGNDAVDFTGVFLMILNYRARNGEERSAPFFLAKSMRKYY